MNDQNKNLPNIELETSDCDRPNRRILAIQGGEKGERKERRVEGKKREVHVLFFFLLVIITSPFFFSLLSLVFDLVCFVLFCFVLY